MISKYSTLERWMEHVRDMSNYDETFWDRRKLRAMGRLDGGYEFGYEIEGYGTIVGYCNDHKPHRTDAQARDCGFRFLRGDPPRFIDRMPWRRRQYA